MSIEKPISSVFNSAATVGGVIGLIAIFIPVTKDFMILHPLWGWGLFICTLVMSSVVGEHVARKRESAATNRMQKKFDDLDLQARQIDIELIKTRMNGLGQDSDFYIYLVGDISYEHLPSWFSSRLEKSLKSWERDKRDIKDTSLSEVWTHCLNAAKSYSKNIADHMQVKERRPDALEILPILGSDNPAEFDQAELALKNAGTELELAMQEVHRVTHLG